MLLKSSRIANFRAFKDEQHITFGCPNGNPGSGLTIVLGPNNAGKSTVLSMLRSFFSQDDRFVIADEDRRGTALPRMSVTVEENGEERRIAVEPETESAFAQRVGFRPDDWTKVRSIPSRRPWNDEFNINMRMSESDYETNFFSSYRSSKNYVDNNFGAALAEIEQDLVAKRTFTDLLKAIEPTISSWAIRSRSRAAYVSFEGHSGVPHSAGNVGDGVFNIFRLAFAIYSASSQRPVLIDEPELSLHPQSQKALYNLLSSKSQSCQIVVATHSPYFVSWRDLRNGAHLYRVNPSSAGSTLRHLQPESIAKIARITDSDVRNRRLYDVVAKEVFFSRGTVFVEGYEDVHIWHEFIERNRLPDLEIFGYGSGGASHIGSWAQMARDLGIRCVGLFDGDPAGQAGYDRCIQEFAGSSDVLFLRLTTEDIRDKRYIDSEGRPCEKEGLFDASWSIKPEHEAEAREILAKCRDHLRLQ